MKQRVTAMMKVIGTLAPESRSQFASHELSVQCSPAALRAAANALLMLTTWPDFEPDGNTQRRNKFFHLAMRRGRKIAKVAMARRLAVHLYWMWRQGCDGER